MVGAKRAFAVLIAVLSCGSAGAEEIGYLKVEGTQNVSEGTVLEAVSSVPGTELDEQTVRQDMERIFAAGDFSKVDVRVGEREGKLELVYELRENPVIRDICFKGLEGIDVKPLIDQMSSRRGEVLNNLKVKRDLERLSSCFESEGFGIRVLGCRLNEENALVIECRRPMVRRIRIAENASVKERVIRRYLSVKEGDAYNPRSVEKDIARLKRTGLFYDVKSAVRTLENGDVDVILLVSENKPAVIKANAGYGTDSGALGGLEFTHFNVGGNAQKISLGLALSEDDYKSCWATWSDPYMTDRIYAWSAGVYASEDDGLTYRYSSNGRRFDAFNYEEKTKGAFFSLSKWLTRGGEWSFKGTIDRHSSEVGCLDEAAGGYSKSETKSWFDEVTGGDADSEVLALRLELMHNGLNSYVPYPDGWKRTFGAEQAFKALGGDCDYFKYWVEVNNYIPLCSPFKNFTQSSKAPVTLALRAAAGWSSGDVPIAERYSLGGAGTMRGYESGDFKGSEMFLGNAELRVPILKNFTLVGFYDMGNAWEEDSMDLSDLYDNYGVGGRFNTPAGPVRVDLAWGGDETRWSLSMGEMF